MKRKNICLWLPMVLLILVSFTAPVPAGNLEPTEPPGPTMKTLDEVEPRIPISSLPFTIDESGSYYLTGDLTSTGNGIIVEADNVTIDLMGYSLIGTGSGDNRGIYLDLRRNVEIRNGTVQGFSEGIWEAGTNSARGHRVVDVRVISNLGYGMLLCGYGHLVKDCIATENGVMGIFVHKGCTVTESTAYNNQNAGIIADEGCMVTGNTAHENQGAGIKAYHGCTVTGNTAYKNQGPGISSLSGSVVTGNTAYENHGVGISGGTGCTVTGNTAYKNQGPGISGDNSCTVTGNTAYDNSESDLFIHAGIRIHSDCVVRGNTVINNKVNNILVHGSRNSIEHNLVTNSSNGVYFSAGGNFYANNRSSGNTTDYANTGGNTDGGGNVSF